MLLKCVRILNLKYLMEIILCFKKNIMKRSDSQQFHQYQQNIV